MSQIYNFEKYGSKVFKLMDFLSMLQDDRKEPEINIQKIFLGYYFGSAFRMKATSTIEEETRKGVLRKRVGAISDDTIGYGLEHLRTESIQEGWYMLGRRAKRNGMLRDSPFDDYIVGVLDGIETYSSYNRKCDNCLTRKVTVKVKGKGKKGKKVKKTQYYHKSVVLTLVGYDFPIPIGLEMMRKGEDEVKCAQRLLERIVNKLGVRFLDIVICDALYCTPNFFKACKKLDIHAGAVLKANQENLLESARSQTKITKPVINEETDKEKLKLWDLGEIFWDTADRDVRVIWADREVWERDESSKEKSSHWVEKRKVFAFSKEIDHLSTKVVYSIGRHRWDIDAKIFMDMGKHWHLKHKTLHFPKAYENMLSIRFIAYFAFMFFFYRHINSRRKEKIKSYIEMARTLYRSACDNPEPETILLE